MPASNAYWIVSFRPDSDESFSELLDRFSRLAMEKTSNSTLTTPLAQLLTPEFKVAPLATLISLSETLSKNEPVVNQTLQKIVDTLKTLVASKPTAFKKKSNSKDPQPSINDNLLMDDGRSYESYLFKNWEWNRGKYNRVESRKLEELVETLLKDITSIENSHKLKLSSYNQAKTQSQALLRKKTGNLSVKSLAEVVTQDHFVDSSSEFLETLLVAVPNNNVKDWTNSYEHLTSLVVPRSSSKLAEDEEFTLFNVTVFKKIKEEYCQKCRENKFTVREFVFDQAEIEKSRTELKEFQQQEKELWSELLRLCRINFSDVFQAIVHLKVIQTHIESLLRYGLPSHFCTIIIKPDSKNSKKIINLLNSFYNSLESNQSSKKQPNRKALKNGKDNNDDSIVGEYANLLEQELFDFVLFEIIDPIRDEKEF